MSKLSRFIRRQIRSSIKHAMYRQKSNSERKELAIEGRFFTETGTPFSGSYCYTLKNQGVYVDIKGYKRYLNSDKLVHRHVAEKYIVKRSLDPDEVVHHINCNKMDNRTQNLRVLSKEKHDLYHSKGLIFKKRR